MRSGKRRCLARLRPHVSRVGAGLLAVLAACPGLAQSVSGPAPSSGQPPPAAAPEQPPTASTTPSPSVTPPQPISPFGPAPGVFPNLAPTPTRPQPASPFGPAPGVFPNLAPTPSTPQQPASPFGPAPGVFPNLGSPVPSAGVAPGTPAARLPVPSAVVPGAPTTTSEQPSPALGTVPAIPPGAPVTPAALATPPLTPGFGFGPPLGATPDLTPPVPPTAVGLRAVRPGALPVQTGNNRAPPILVLPTATLSESVTDNVRSAPNAQADLISHFGGGTAISFDTARLQGQLNGSLDYRKYARATDLDALNANLLAFGLATVVRDHVFVDGRATVTQLSTTGGVGFANPTIVPSSQQTQATVISLSPIVRESIDGYVDGEFRYNYGLSMFGSGSLLNNTASTVPSATTVPSNTPSDATTNEATLTLATGRRFAVFGSRLTLDASKVDSQSAAKSTQLTAVDAMEYRFNSTFAALAQFGYEKLDFPSQPAASTSGPIWAIGGRMTPYGDTYFSFQYGRQQGSEGFTGDLHYELTPSTTLLASASHGLSSTQQGILSNLNTSIVNANGNVVNQTTGLPSALTNPQFALSNTVFNQEQVQAGVQTALGRNTFTMFAFIEHRDGLGTPIPVAGVPQASSGSDTSRGVNFTWSRSLTPRLGSSASLGYASTVVSHTKTLTADLGLTYTLSDRFSAVFHYQFINSDNATLSSATTNGSYRRNQVEIGLTRSF